MNIIFILEFNVEVGRGAYRIFIEGLRNRLAGDRVSHDRPVLPPQAQPPTEWFVIVLRTSEHHVRLLFRRDNLYLDAYQMEGPQSQTWLEFSAPKQTQHLIPGSTFLGFDGSYDGTHGLENTAGRTRASIRLCRDSLRNAVNHLASSDDWQVRAESLLVVVQMVAESVRYEEMTYFVLRYYIAGDPGLAPEDRILTLENNWGTISNALLRSDAHPELSIFPLGFPEIYRINSAPEVAAAIGILLFNVKGIPPRAPRSLLAAEDLGRALVEVFALKINNIDGENPGDLYGTVTVTNGLISQYLYNRERGDNESIYPGENALLSGPAARAISAMDSFTINVALMDKDSFPDPSPDDHISDGQIEWNVYHPTNEYDVAISEKIDGANGSATVVYAVFSNATQATVEVTMIDGDGENPANLYGTLAATNTKISSDDYESVLFSKDLNDVVDVRPGELLPLSRSVVAVPLDSNLIVRANLYDYDRVSSDDQIAKGTANFPAQLSGTSQQNISGEDGKIQVKVTWTP